MSPPSFSGWFGDGDDGETTSDVRFSIAPRPGSAPVLASYRGSGDGILGETARVALPADVDCSSSANTLLGNGASIATTSSTGVELEADVLVSIVVVAVDPIVSPTTEGPAEDEVDAARGPEEANTMSLVPA